RFDIVRLPGERADAVVRPERHRAAVTTAGVAGDHVGFGSDAEFEAAKLGGCETEMPIGTEDTQTPIGAAMVGGLGRRTHARSPQSRRIRQRSGGTNQRTVRPSTSSARGRSCAVISIGPDRMV